MYRLHSLLFSPGIALSPAAIAVLLILLSVTACAPVPERPVEPTVDPLALAAEELAAQGDYLAAAQLYLSASKTASENQRIALRLRAAEYLARGQLWEQLAPVLASIDPTALDPTQQARYQLLLAQQALAEHQTNLALELLEEISHPEALPDHGQGYYRLRAQAYAITGNALEAARQLIWLDGLLEKPQQILENQYGIWEQLSSLSDNALQQLSTSPPPDPLSGWMELVLLTRQNRSDRQQWMFELDNWRMRYPDHAAESALLPDLLDQLTQPGVQVNRIAVLLPLTGRTAESAAAIRDGMMAAYYRGGPQSAELHFYDTGGEAQLLWSVYQRAIQDGAEFVIGPLLKDSIQQLAQSGHLPVPVLALNQTGAEQAAELPLYQFGLSPEDEARQVAERISSDGHRQVIALVPDSAWGNRVLSAFEERLVTLGGEILTTGRYAAGSADFKGPIQSTFNLQNSRARHRSLEGILGQKLEYEPRRRQDVEAIFMLGFPRQARQIKPQLRFHHAGDVPVYSTSHVFTASSDPATNRDMEGLLFCDIPWVLDQEGQWAEERRNLQSVWPTRSQRYQRLFALGFDAYQVIPWLDILNIPGFAHYPGATGVLTLDQDKQLHRALEWAQLRNGTAQKILSREGQDEPERNWQPR